MRFVATIGHNIPRLGLNFDGGSKRSESEAASHQHGATHPQVLQVLGGRSAPRKARDLQPREAAAVAARLDELNLSSSARVCAEELMRQHGTRTTFTSGRRDMAKQASAMAVNVVKSRTWILDTYRASPQRKELQSWFPDGAMSPALAKARRQRKIAAVRRPIRDRL